jgi:hypothetical protein
MKKTLLLFIFSYAITFVLAADTLSTTFGESAYLCENTEGCSNTLEPFEEGEVMPELNPFFPTMLAQPHMLGYSVGYRSYDKIFKSTIPVSIGDQFSFYQFKLDRGQLFVGLEACVWAVFEAKTKSLSLINADYFVGLPLTYINDRFSARLRISHQSSHIGDEFLLDRPEFNRVNPSMEVVDLSLGYEVLDGLVYFAGYSRVLRSDDSYKVKPNCIFYGFNYFLNSARINILNVDAIPYIATYFTNNENNNWKFDSSVTIGYQLNKSYGHKLRLFIAGRNGYSAEGQFSRRKAKSVSVHLQYGY